MDSESNISLDYNESELASEPDPRETFNLCDLESDPGEDNAALNIVKNYRPSPSARLQQQAAKGRASPAPAPVNKRPDPRLERRQAAGASSILGKRGQEGQQMEFDRTPGGLRGHGSEKGSDTDSITSNPDTSWHPLGRPAKKIKTENILQLRPQGQVAPPEPNKVPMPTMFLGGSDTQINEIWQTTPKGNNQGWNNRGQQQPPWQSTPRQNTEQSTRENQLMEMFRNKAMPMTAIDNQSRASSDKRAEDLDLSQLGALEDDDDDTFSLASYNNDNISVSDIPSTPNILDVEDDDDIDQGGSEIDINEMVNVLSDRDSVSSMRSNRSQMSNQSRGSQRSFIVDGERTQTRPVLQFAGLGRGDTRRFTAGMREPNVPQAGPRGLFRQSADRFADHRAAAMPQSPRYVEESTTTGAVKPEPYIPEGPRQQMRDFEQDRYSQGSVRSVQSQGSGRSFQSQDSVRSAQSQGGIRIAQSQGSVRSIQGQGSVRSMQAQGSVRSGYSQASVQAMDVDQNPRALIGQVFSDTASVSSNMGNIDAFGLDEGQYSALREAVSKLKNIQRQEILLDLMKTEAEPEPPASDTSMEQYYTTDEDQPRQVQQRQVQRRPNQGRVVDDQAYGTPDLRVRTMQPNMGANEDRSFVNRNRASASQGRMVTDQAYGPSDQAYGTPDPRKRNNQGMRYNRGIFGNQGSRINQSMRGNQGLRHNQGRMIARRDNQDYMNDQGYMDDQPYTDDQPYMGDDYETDPVGDNKSLIEDYQKPSAPAPTARDSQGPPRAEKAVPEDEGYQPVFSTQVNFQVKDEEPQFDDGFRRPYGEPINFRNRGRGHFQHGGPPRGGFNRGRGQGPQRGGMMQGGQQGFEPEFKVPRPPNRFQRGRGRGGFERGRGRGFDRGGRGGFDRGRGGFDRGSRGFDRGGRGNRPQFDRNTRALSPESEASDTSDMSDLSEESIPGDRCGPLPSDLPYFPMIWRHNPNEIEEDNPWPILKDDDSRIPVNDEGLPFTFEDYFLKPELVSALRDDYITEPTRLQHEALPELLNGVDICMYGEPGSGKSLAHVLAVLQQIDTSKQELQAVIAVPFRQRVVQIHHMLENLSRYFEPSLKLCLGVGGNSLKVMRHRLKHRQCHVLLGSYGKLCTLMKKGIVAEEVKIFVVEDLAVVYKRDTMVRDFNILNEGLACRKQFIATVNEGRTFHKKVVASHFAKGRVIEFEPQNIITFYKNFNHAYCLCSFDEKNDLLVKHLSEHFYTKAVIRCYDTELGRKVEKTLKLQGMKALLMEKTMAKSQDAEAFSYQSLVEENDIIISDRNIGYNPFDLMVLYNGNKINAMHYSNMLRHLSKQRGGLILTYITNPHAVAFFASCQSHGVPVKEIH